jgi:ribonuclease HI
MKIEVFTDGGCIGNPGPGAWAYVIDDRNGRIEGSGYNPETTNNRMELTAVIEVLSFLRESAGSDAEQSRQFVIHTDSQYVKNGITQWIHNWKRNGWKTAAKKPVKNQDLWMKLDVLSTEIQPEWTWVKGHAGIELNERCDQLVQEAIAGHGGK